MFKTNESSWDRGIRIALGLVMMVLGFGGIITGWVGTVVGIVGLVPLVTGLVGWCPLYELIHVDTLGPPKAAH